MQKGMQRGIEKAEKKKKLPLLKNYLPTAWV